MSSTASSRKRKASSSDGDTNGADAGAGAARVSKKAKVELGKQAWRERCRRRSQSRRARTKAEAATAQADLQAEYRKLADYCFYDDWNRKLAPLEATVRVYQSNCKQLEIKLAEEQGKLKRAQADLTAIVADRAVAERQRLDYAEASYKPEEARSKKAP